MTEPLPAGFFLRPGSDLRRRDNGRILVGGTPFRILRLSSAGASLVSAWFNHEPVSDKPAHRALARRLADAGLVYPEARPDEAEQAIGPTSAVTAVIPVHNDPDGLALTLTQLADTATVVIDDGSDQAISLAHRTDHRLIRRATAGGPGVARNDGLQQVDTPLTLFIDAGVVLSPADLRSLERQFDDPAVAAVAPRVTTRSDAGSARSAVDRYEMDRSPLDLGEEPGRVGPGRRLSYVPSACLVVRTDVVRGVGGFDPALRYGEDVDLMWRLADDHTVLFHASAVASHPPRPSLAAFCRQRLGYGSAAGPLAHRHGSTVAPVRSSGWSLAVAGLALVGHPWLAAVAGAGTAVALAPKLDPLPDPQVEAVLLASKGHWWTLRSLCQTSLRTWWPLTALAIFSGFGRRTALLAAGVGWLQRLLDHPAKPVIDLALGPIDDISYGTGVWLGAVRQRSARALLPALVNWPPRSAKSSMSEETSG